MRRIKLHVIDWDVVDAVAIWEHEGKCGVAFGDKYPFVTPERVANINHVGRRGIKWYNNMNEAEKAFENYKERRVDITANSSLIRMK